MTDSEARSRTRVCCDELLDGRQSHGQRQHDGGGTGQPGGLEGRDQRAARGTDDRDVIAGGHPSVLEGRGHRLGLFVELGPRDPIGLVALEEHDVAAASRGAQIRCVA